MDPETCEAAAKIYKANALMSSWRNALMFTVGSEDEWRGRAEHFVPRHSVVDHAGVVAHVGALHLRHVQIPRLLRDEATTVLLDEIRILVEDPGIRQLWVTEVERSLTQSLQDDPVPVNAP